MHRAHEHAYLLSVFAMSSFSAKSEICNKTCYVYMGAIISSSPFWLMDSKGLLIYALSRFMSCLVLLCSVPVVVDILL